MKKSQQAQQVQKNKNKNKNKIFNFTLIFIFIFSTSTAFADLSSRTKYRDISATVTPTAAAGSQFIQQNVKMAQLTLSGNFSGVFGRVAPGQEIRKLLTIRNIGITEATSIRYSLSHIAFKFTGGAAPGLFGTCGSSLSAGAECALEISFLAPSSSQTLSERLVITYTDSTKPASPVTRSFTLGLYGASRTSSEMRTAYKAQLDYDVVYIRCLRGQTNVPVSLSANTGENWGGINDMWIDASNNIHQQPGCSLVLHHSNWRSTDRFPQEEVLVPCQSTDISLPQCTVFDPNVSFDGRYIVYAKTLDTRSFMTEEFNGGMGYDFMNHSQAVYKFEGDKGVRGSMALDPYASPTYIFEYDLVKRKERQVSKNSLVHGERANFEFNYQPKTPVMDTNPAYLPDGSIVFTSNRENGYSLFQMYRMDRNGENVRLLGSRAISQQLHPFILMDGRIIYTSADFGFGRAFNNTYSYFQQYPDGSFPFIFAGKLDPTVVTYHYATQLSDGDVISTVYYNHNNMGTGSFIRFPANPLGPQWAHSYDRYQDNRIETFTTWAMGNSFLPFIRVDQSWLTPNMPGGDDRAYPYENPLDRFISLDGHVVKNQGKVTHPAAAPYNALLATYAIGSGSTVATTIDPTHGEFIGRDGGVWLFPLEPNSKRQIGHVADDAVIVVDDPHYHEIMPRAVVPYWKIYGKNGPDIKKEEKNDGKTDARVAAGEPFALSGASSLIDRETAALNGTPWNASDPGGYMAGRVYTNMATQGADLAIYSDDEIYGVRVLMPVPLFPTGFSGWDYTLNKQQNHQLRILGEFPVRDFNKGLIDLQGNPDTSFIVKIPAETPFVFQALDKRGMGLNIENTPRSMVAGEKQTCIGCHVHTRTGMDPSQAPAIAKSTFAFGDMSKTSAPLFKGINPANGQVIVEAARNIYPTNERLQRRRTFAVDFKNEIGPILQNRCASCHGEGRPAHLQTGLRLDSSRQTFDLLIDNAYKVGSTVRVGSLITKPLGCCLTSRWHSRLSARSSMLVWALYGERLDGRNPETGLPYPGSGVLIDPFGKDVPDTWPNVREHLTYVEGMPEEEKRMISRWIDIGGPYDFVADQYMRPVVTITPQVGTVSTPTGGISKAIVSISVGLWADSPLDYSSFKVFANGTDITPDMAAVIAAAATLPATAAATLPMQPSVVNVALPQAIVRSNALNWKFQVEIQDRPGESFSSSVVPAKRNRQVKIFDGYELLRKSGLVTK